MQLSFIWHIQTRQEQGTLVFSRLGPIKFSGKMSRVNHRGRVRSLGLLVYLFALAAQVSVPIVHSLHLSLEHAITPMGFGFSHCLPDHGPGAPPLTVSRDGEGLDHHHDPCHCPICQAMSLLSSFAAPRHDAESCMPLKSPEVLSGSFGKKLLGRCFSNCAARAPPNVA